MLAKYYKKTSFGDKKRSFKKGSFGKFFKSLPDLLDNVRQNSVRLFKGLKGIKKQDLSNLFKRDSLKNFYQFIYRTNNKQKIIFSLVIVLVASVFSIIKYNQKTMIDGAAFHRSVLSEWDYISDKNAVGMKASLKKEKTALGVLIERDDSQLEFQLPINNPSLEVKDNTATYINADKNMEVKYEFKSNKIKESIILNSQTDNFEFTSSFLVQNLIVKMNDERIPVFFDTNNNYQFHLERPYAIDANGQTTFDLSYTLKPKTSTINSNPFTEKRSIPKNLLELETLKDIPVNTNEYELIVSVDPQWLLDPARQYPIVIDPTITHDTSAEFAVGTFNRVTDTGSGTSPVLESYYQQLAADERVIGLWHMDEASGNLIDASGNGNTAINSGSTVTTGLINNGRNFSSGMASAGILYSPDFTAAAWIYPIDLTNQPMVFSNGQWTVDGWYTHTRENGVGGISVVTNQSGTAQITSSVEGFELNEWQHWAITKEGPIVNIYKNGRNITTTHAQHIDGAVPATNQFTIGSYFAAPGSYYFNGKIDEAIYSNKAMSAEEIESMAQHKPYATYTSPVIDLGTNPSDWSAFQKLSWTESGGQTGDGETPSDSTGLIAQWNFNDLGGSASNKTGSCNSICNGSLEMFFTSLEDRDTSPVDGWTTDKKWGAGALKLDGANDYVSIPDNDFLSFGNGSSDEPFSISTWVYPESLAETSSGNWIINKRDAGADDEWQLCFWQKNIYFQLFSSNANNIGKYTNDKFETNKWYNIVATYDGSKNASGVKIYVNGKEQAVSDNINGTYVGMHNGSEPVTIGKPGWSNSLYFNGIIDTTQIYSRELSAEEVLNNYNATNVQFQTRAGSDSTPDDGSWEEWKPANESTLEDFETTYLYNTDEDGLIAYYPMDEGSGTTVDDVSSGNHDGTFNGIPSWEPGKFDTGIYAGNSVNDFFVPLAAIDIDEEWTASTWFKYPLTTMGANWWTLFRGNGGGDHQIIIQRGTNLLGMYDNDGGTGFHSTGFDISTLSYGWHHIATVGHGDVQDFYIDGVFVGQTDDKSRTNIYYFGGIGSQQWGKMDEVRIYNKALTATRIKELFLQGSNEPDLFSNSTDTVIKQVGSKSERIETGTLKADEYTVGLWHLDETGGTGAYVKDSSGNGHHGTPTATSVVRGIKSKALDFNGSTSVIAVPASTDLDLTGDYTLEAWVKPSSLGIVQGIMGKYSDNGWGLNLDASNLVNFGRHSCSNFSGTTPLQAGQWYYVVGVYQESGDEYVYVNGIREATGSLTDGNCNNDTSSVVIGQYRTSTLFNGSIDEVRISNVARDADEIAENYRMGRDHYLNYNLGAAQDLSNKSTLPFYIAADRPGTYLSATIGESAFANYQPDEHTISLWHLDDRGGLGDFISDSAGSSNNGTPTNTSPTTGIIGRARSFSGSGEYITIGDKSSLKITNNMTIDMWVYPTDFAARRNPWAKAYGGEGTITQETNATFNYYYGEGGGNATPYQGFNSATAIPAYQWSHIAIVRDLDNKKLRWYINGILTNETDALYNGSVSTLPAYIGTGYTNNYAGMIDEVRISDIARTSDEIRQAYDVGKRTHSITIDFGALLDSGNLITGSGDTSFTVDATAYGLSNKGSNLYKGDKIIVRENYNGTEYIAQGLVDSVTESTGAVTVSAWDTGSTFPASGFTANAEVFKWQREFFDISGSKKEHRDTASLLTFRLTSDSEGRTIWLDDAKAAADYLTTPLSSAIVSTTGNRYVQYKTIFTTTDAFVSSSISEVTMDGFDGSGTSTGNCYLEESPHDDQITIHWDDNATGELGFEIEKRINGTIWNTLDRTSANITAYNDDDISSGNTYQYRIRSFSDDGTTGAWCATSVVDLGTGSFRFEGLKMDGIKLD